MTKKIFLILSVLLPLLLSAVLMSSSTLLGGKLTELSQSILVEVLSQQADVLIAVTRNEFILNNSKYAKALLEKSVSKSGISQIEVFSESGDLVETVGENPGTQTLVTIKKKIYYNESERNRAWGTFVFKISSSQFSSFANATADFRSYIILPTFLILLLLFASIFYVFGYSSIRIDRFLDLSASHKVRKLESFFWSRLISKILEAKHKLVTTIEQKHALAKDAVFIDISRQVAHDIRSPLSALNIAVGALKSSRPEIVSLIENASVRINSIADDLLNQTKKIGVAENYRCDVLATAQSVVREKRLHSGIDFQVTCLAKNRIFAKIESSQLARILSNLLNNSIEASEKTAQPISIEIAESDEFAVIRIRDTGIGMSFECLEMMGTKGFTTKGSAAGNGLGISTAKHLIEEMGGALKVESQLQNGTTVTLSIPTCSL